MQKLLLVCGGEICYCQLINFSLCPRPIFLSPLPNFPQLFQIAFRIFTHPFRNVDVLDPPIRLPDDDFLDASVDDGSFTSITRSSLSQRAIRIQPRDIKGSTQEACPMPCSVYYAILLAVHGRAVLIGRVVGQVQLIFDATNLRTVDHPSCWPVISGSYYNIFPNYNSSKLSPQAR